MTIQVITAQSRSGDNGLVKEEQYLFTLTTTVEGFIRIFTFPGGIELYYHTIHDFLLSWDNVTSQGWANDEQGVVNIITTVLSGKPPGGFADDVSNN